MYIQYTNLLNTCVFFVMFIVFTIGNTEKYVYIFNTLISSILFCIFYCKHFKHRKKTQVNRTLTNYYSI